MKHIKKALSYSIAGSLGLTVVAAITGCEQPAQNQTGFDAMPGEQQNQNQFIVIEQTGTNPDAYRVVEKHSTSGPTRAILRDMSGNERFLSEEELRQMAEAEAEKVEAGTSRLTQEQQMSGGMSLGETILAAAAGSLIGGLLANSLMGSKNFQQHQQRHGGGRPAASLARNNTTSGKKPSSGFFGGNKNQSSSSSSRSGSSSFGG